MKRKILIVLAVIGAILAANIFYFFDPSSSGWVIKCPFKAMTGFDCPSCGNQRLVHALLHGRFVEAFYCNPFTMLSIPYLIPVFLTLNSKKGFLLKVRNIVQAPIVLYIYAGLACVWWVLRNII